MSFQVLVIPEDPLQNGHILRPLVQAIMRDAGRPAAKVTVLESPRLRGYDQAVRSLPVAASREHMVTEVYGSSSRMRIEPPSVPYGIWRHTSPNRGSRCCAAPRSRR